MSLDVIHYGNFMAPMVDVIRAKGARRGDE